MRTFPLFLLVLKLCGPNLMAGEIKASDRLALVREEPDEILRKQLIAALGDLNKYAFLWIHPERVFQASAISQVSEGDKIWYDLSYWPGNIRKEEIIKTRLSEADAKLLLESISRVFKKANEPAQGLEHVNITDKILMFKKFDNPQGVEWLAVEIQTESLSPDFKKILELTIPKSAKPSQSDIDAFFGK